jgi:hypothetical protein
LGGKIFKLERLREVNLSVRETLKNSALPILSHVKSMA